MKTSSFVSSAGPGCRALGMIRNGRPLVIAHRGYSAIAPENTLPSFSHALAAGADLVELDYYHCRDGVPVVFHDATLDRTTDAVTRWSEKGSRIGMKTWRELAELDAGAWFHPRYAGNRLLSLEEAIDVIQGGSLTLIERKSGDPETLIALLRGKGWIGDVVVQSFDWDFLRLCHRLAPQLTLGALGPPDSRDGETLPTSARELNSSFLDEAAATGAKVVGWNHQVTAQSIADAHVRGLCVWVYVVNDLDRAARLLEAGVDGLITDNPGLIWKSLALRNHGGR